MNLGENLQNLRKQKRMSQEELASTLNVSRQAVSKWESNGTLPETENLIAICEIFHCSMDDLLNGQMSYEKNTNKIEYDKIMNSFSKSIATGIFLILIGVTFLLIMIGFAPDPSLEEKYSMFGVIILLCFIAIAVPIFIVNGININHFKKKNAHLPEFYNDQEIEKFHHKFAMLIASGVSILLLGLILFIASMAFEIWEKNDVLGLALFMGFVTVAVPIFVYAGLQKSKYDIATYNKIQRVEQKESEMLIEKISGVIMIITTIIYFILGFIFHLWQISWIVYPIAGMICGIISIILTKEN